MLTGRKRLRDLFGPPNDRPRRHQARGHDCSVERAVLEQGEVEGAGRQTRPWVLSFRFLWAVWVDRVVEEGLAIDVWFRLPRTVREASEWERKELERTCRAQELESS